LVEPFGGRLIINMSFSGYIGDRRNLERAVRAIFDRAGRRGVSLGALSTG
jgi:hypothetical protein